VQASSAQSARVAEAHVRVETPGLTFRIVAPEKLAKVLRPVPVTVTLSGNRVIADVIS
jgi:hypothetical protein